MIHLGEER
jgi:hypothetical protein